MSEENTPVSAKPSWMPKAIGLVAVIIIGAIVAMTQGKKAVEPTVAVVPEIDPVVPVADAKAPQETTKTDAAVSAPTEKDGVYSTTGNYVSPAGPETIDVTLTVKDGLIADASVKANATNPISLKLQGMFIDGYKEFVIGKKLSDLSLSKVSGSSLTPKGFNEALAEIRTQASV